jgi:putative membrane protein
VRLSVGPWQRALRLATVHVDSTKGPVGVVLHYRDLAEGRRIVDAEVVLAERGRAVRMPDRWMTTNSGPATAG